MLPSRVIDPGRNVLEYDVLRRFLESGGEEGREGSGEGNAGPRGHSLENLALNNVDANAKGVAGPQKAVRGWRLRSFSVALAAATDCTN